MAETAIHAYVLGEHGDSQIVAWSSAHVGGKPLLDFPEMKTVDKEKLSNDIARKAYEIINLKGSTYFGIAGCVSSLVHTIAFDERHIRPLSVYVEEFQCVLSMPVVLGSSGVERIIDVHLNVEEKSRLQKSAAELSAICKKYV